MLKSIGLIFNPGINDPYTRSRVLKALKNIRTVFKGDLLLTPEAFKTLNGLTNFKIKADEAEVVRASQAIACIGGDGTVIHTVHLMDRLKAFDKILYTINTSEIGKLTQFDFTKESINHMLGNTEADLTEEKRCLYSCLVNSETPVNFFNELYLCSEKLTTFTIANPGKALEFKASGLIISTSQGTTGMANSFGGPTISPYLYHLAILTLTPVGVLRERVAPIVTDSNPQIFAEGSHQLIVDGGKIRSSYRDRGSYIIDLTNHCSFMAIREYTHLT